MKRLVQGDRGLRRRDMIRLDREGRVMRQMPGLADIGIQQDTNVVDRPIALHPGGKGSNPGVELVIHRHFDELIDWAGHRTARQCLIPVSGQIIHGLGQGNRITDCADIIVVDRYQLVRTTEIGVPCEIV